MSELELLPLNHPMMKVPPDEFDFEKEDAKELADLIWKRQRELGGAGLSANQVGRNAKMFTMGVDRGEDYNYKRVLFNPELTAYSEETDVMEEGCLSAPGITLMVRRPIKCTMSYKNEDNEMVLEEFDGLWARVALHEYDHMQGRVFTELVSKFRLKRAKEKGEKMMKQMKKRQEANQA